ncbi:response regulator transcription factor [Marinobacterium sp. AK62]|uniref:Response regulator transcription factor n=1 Tax=Marinobacterium alkalitolerans TaxID=1542925 RepID=A0ABS3Z7J9_9GAMM|nr:response regulator transcription factor [Marinobacterium alkalitolerans]MBP0047680.1 response regulator transcription factor [Marinobacterium alkalitolerans]
MITRTEQGYALNGWEARPMPLPSGGKFTRGESRAAVCRVNGMKAKDAAKELGCSTSCISQYWQSIYYKLGCDNAIVAINRLVELGALHRLQVLLLALMLGAGSVTSASTDTDFDIETRTGRARGARITRRSSGKRGRAGRFAGASGALLADLDFWASGNAGDIYTHADAQGGLS